MCSPEVQGALLAAFNMGFLQIWSKGLFSDDWKEYFFILSNIGLIGFEKLGVLYYSDR